MADIIPEATMRVATLFELASHLRRNEAHRQSRVGYNLAVAPLVLGINKPCEPLCLE